MRHFKSFVADLYSNSILSAIVCWEIYEDVIWIYDKKVKGRIL
jgi:hypothetical protein